MGDSMAIYHGHASPSDLAACRAAAPSYTHGIMWSDPDRMVTRDEPYAVDNGAYSGFEPDTFTRMLEAVGDMPRPPEFVILPDEMGDPEGTRARHRKWHYIVEEHGYPYYAVGQPPMTADGILQLADACEADGVFLGGDDTSWKFDMAEAIDEYPVHIGSPGLGPNLRHAETVGCVSVDTTSIVVNDYYHHLERLEEQESLYGVTDHAE